MITKPDGVEPVVKVLGAKPNLNPHRQPTQRRPASLFILNTNKSSGLTIEDLFDAQAKILALGNVSGRGGMAWQMSELYGFYFRKAYEDRTCKPLITNTYAAEKLHLDLKTVKAVKKRLKKHGYIRVVPPERTPSEVIPRLYVHVIKQKSIRVGTIGVIKGP